MSNKDTYLANKNRLLEEITLAESLPAKYDNIKNEILNRNNELVKIIDRKIAAAEALEAKLADTEYNQLKKYGETLDIETLRNLKEIDDDKELTQEQKCFMITCKGGKSQVKQQTSEKV